LKQRYAIFLFGFVMLYGLRLGDPPLYVFDELYTAFTAHRIAVGDDKVFEPGVRRYRYLEGDTSDLALVSRGEWSHPPGAPSVMSLFVKIFGFHAASVRVVTMLAALGALVATAAMAGRRWWIACTLLALDGTFFVLARTAMPHMFVAAGIAGAAALLHRAALTGRARFVVLAGACVGLAASARWTALPIAVALAIAVAVSRRRAIGWRAVAGGVAAAVATYVLMYLPYFAHGHGLGDLAHLHAKMLEFNRHIRAPSGQVQPWWAWPFNIDAVLFAWRPGARGALVLCTGSRTLWWPLVPVVVLAIRRWVRTRALRDGIAAAVILGTWLPWALLSRQGLPYYLLPALPFCAVLVTRELAKIRIRWTWTYLALALINFVVLYPVISGAPLEAPVRTAYRAVLLHGAPE
jgi:4-amino-4-deoxy-L-arabinose transferase-like glycosyltransferase